MFEADIIQPSESPWASEYVVVKKKTGDWRMCVEFRRLISMTKKNSFPLTNTDECLVNFVGKTYFSKLDLASGLPQSQKIRNRILMLNNTKQ